MCIMRVFVEVCSGSLQLHVRLGKQPIQYNPSPHLSDAQLIRAVITSATVT